MRTIRANASTQPPARTTFAGRAGRGFLILVPAAVVSLLAAMPAASLPHARAQQERSPQPQEQSERRADAVQMGAPGLVPPRMLTRELPEYTEAAREAGIEGDVYIEAVVTTEGTVVEPILIRGLPDDELNQRALAAVSEWTFEPGVQDDEPVDVLALFTVTFRSR